MQKKAEKWQNMPDKSRVAKYAKKIAKKVAKYARKSEKKVKKYARKSEKSEKNMLVPAEIAEICKNMQNKSSETPR